MRLVLRCTWLIDWIWDKKRLLKSRWIWGDPTFLCLGWVKHIRHNPDRKKLTSWKSVVVFWSRRRKFHLHKRNCIGTSKDPQKVPMLWDTEGPMIIEGSFKTKEKVMHQTLSSAMHPPIVAGKMIKTSLMRGWCITLGSLPSKLQRNAAEPNEIFVDSWSGNQQASFHRVRPCTAEIDTLRIVVGPSVEWKVSPYIHFFDYERTLNNEEK